MQGIFVSISGAIITSGVPITVNSQALDLPPLGTGDTKLGTPTFFDVSIQGISDGSATVTVDHDNVGERTKMKYLDKTSGKWELAKNQSVSGRKIRGDIDVSKLHGTPIVIGTM